MFRDQGYWAQETLNYSQPHFRLIKCANIINKISRGQKCDLLDVGCGPATLGTLLDPGIDYYGIDISIQQSAPNLIQSDITECGIGFEDRTFDIVVAFGLFEYMGDLEKQKMLEIRKCLKTGGTFITSFVNFGHRDVKMHPAYNNRLPVKVFADDLREFFKIERYFPTSHNWHATEPRREWFAKLQSPLKLNIPVLSPLLAVEYIFICSA